jgi:hypothetical protein
MGIQIHKNYIKALIFLCIIIAWDIVYDFILTDFRQKTVSHVIFFMIMGLTIFLMSKGYNWVKFILLLIASLSIILQIVALMHFALRLVYERPFEVIIGLGINIMYVIIVILLFRIPKSGDKIRS